MKAVEMHYTVDEVALLLRLSRRTVMRRLQAAEFGQVSNLGSDQQPDYRIPASGVNAHLERRAVFSEPGIAARSLGELRRKAAERSSA